MAENSWWKKFVDKYKQSNIDLSKIYPLFFTILFIVIILQYSFSSLEAIFYDLRIKYDLGFSGKDRIVLVVLDEESDQFLGETYPYSYATHERFIQRLLEDSPAVVNYFVNLEEAISKEEHQGLFNFKKTIQEYTKSRGHFRFATDMDNWGEILPPKELRSIGYSLALNNVDSSTFSRDDVCRRAILDISGDESLHLWTANRYRQKKDLNPLKTNAILGSYYLREAEANFTLFRYYFNPTKDSKSVTKIPFHKVAVGSYPKDFFRDKIVLVGSEYVSNSSNFILTPFNKEEYRSSKISVHANIIESLVQNKTIWEVPRTFTSVLSILIGIFLSLVISRLQPARGLFITILTMMSIILISYLLFCLFGLWIYITHLVLTVFIVYYIWVPFRAIDEYQTRYKIQEETKLLKKVDNLKQNFISLMSHDLKTPVAKIAGLADNLSHQFEANSDQRAHLNRIIESTKELNKFITSILDLTKIESSNLRLNLVSKDINILVDDIIYHLRDDAQSKKITIEKELSPLYPIKIDVTLMNRVISNLIENALKYSGEGSSINIKTSDDDEWVYLVIKDNGVGIGKKDLDHIFEKFYRVKNDASHLIKGSGLGLYLVKYFIELHDGTISASSKLGEGTTFTIKLKNK